MSRTSRLLTILVLGGLGCGPKKAPEPVAAAPTAPVVDDSWRAQKPAPLSPRPFALPSSEEGALSNGMRVIVAQNHEVPKVYVTLAFQDGGWTDPKGRSGLARAAMDMLNEGAGDLDAEGLSAALRRLASSLSSGASADGASISLQTLTQNLAPSLDLMALVLTKPTFPDKEWDLLRKQRLADLKTEREDPGQISRRVFNHLLFGDAYLGNLATEEGYKGMKVADLKAWYQAHLRPDRALVLVGGDTTLAEVLPLLEARLGGWKPGAAPPKGAAPKAELPQPEVVKAAEKTTIYLVDKPGASQSVLRIGAPVGWRTDPDAPAFAMANEAFGGLFTSRLNMNLREDKGWTYGARAYVMDSYVPGIWVVGTSVKADTTTDSLSEILREIRESQDTRPLSAQELEVARGNALGTYPVEFETPGALLGGLSDIWRYKLPNDWLSGYPDRLRAVGIDGVNAAWKAHVHADRLAVVVVGDAATLRSKLGALSLPVVELDRDGKVLPPAK